MVIEEEVPYEQLRAAWDAAYVRRDPCWQCGKVTEWHRATCDGHNLCQDCCQTSDCKVSQLYPGDRGYMMAMLPAEFYPKGA